MCGRLRVCACVCARVCDSVGRRANLGVFFPTTLAPGLAIHAGIAEDHGPRASRPGLKRGWRRPRQAPAGPRADNLFGLLLRPSSADNLFGLLLRPSSAHHLFGPAASRLAATTPGSSWRPGLAPDDALKGKVESLLGSVSVSPGAAHAHSSSCPCPFMVRLAPDEPAAAGACGRPRTCIHVYSFWCRPRRYSFWCRPRRMLVVCRHLYSFLGLCKERKQITHTT